MLKLSVATATLRTQAGVPAEQLVVVTTGEEANNNLAIKLWTTRA